VKNLVTIIAALIGAALGFFVMQAIFGGDGGSSYSRIADELTDSSEMYRVIQEEYPEEFEDLLMQLEDVARQPDAEQLAFDISAQHAADLRNRESDNALAADDMLLAAYLARSADTIEKVLVELGETRCGQYGTLGVSALGPAVGDPNILPAIDVQAAALFRALANGQGGEARDLPSQEDYADIASTPPLTEDQTAQLQLVTGQAAGTDGYCEALAWYLRRISVSTTEGAARVRAALTQTLAKG
jgi:hypothetical protein